MKKRKHATASMVTTKLMVSSLIQLSHNSIDFLIMMSFSSAAAAAAVLTSNRTNIVLSVQRNPPSPSITDQNTNIQMKNGNS